MCCTLKDCIFYSRSGKISHKLSLCWENIFCRSLEPSPNASFYFLLDLLAYPEFFGYIDLRQTFCTLMFHRNLNVGIGVSSTACQGCAYPCCAPCTRRLRTLDILVESADITRSKVKGLNTYFDKFNAVVFLTVWVKILHRIEKRDLILQSSSTRL